MKTVQIVLLLALASAPAWGSNAKVDSLKRLLEHHATADKAEVLWNIAYELFDVDNGQAVFYAERAYHEVWKRGDSLQIVKVGTTYGQLLRRVGKVDHSIEVSSQMLPIAKRHAYRKYWKMLLNSLGLVYIDKGKFDVALDLNYQSLILRQEDGDTIELATVLQNLGVVYYKIEDWDNSIEYSKRSIALIESAKGLNWAPYFLSICYENIASVYLAQRKSLKANQYYRLALTIRDTTQFVAPPGNLFWSFASSFVEIGNLDSAKYYVRKAISASRKEYNLYALTQALLVSSNILLIEGDLRQSEYFLDSAILVSANADFSLAHYYVLKQKLRLMIAKGDAHNAMQSLKRYEMFGDSLEILNEKSRIKALQIAFAQRENESKLSAQSTIMLLQRENLDRQQTLVIVVSILLILLLVLSMALYRANGKKQAINQMLDRVVEHRTKELSLHRDTLQHLVDEEDGRRTRITAELGSLLSSLKGILHLAHVDPEKNDKEYLEKAIGLTLQIEGISNKYVEQAHQGRQVLASVLESSIERGSGHSNVARADATTTSKRSDFQR